MLLVFLFAISLFAIVNFLGFALVFLLLAGIILFSGLPRSWIIRGLRPIRYILIFAFLMHVFFTSSGRILFSFGPLTVVDQGLVNGLVTSFRLILLILGTSLLTLTTTPIEITDGLEYLFRPLKVIRLPAHELAMMMTIALRFIPILLIEAERIMKAQMARGADFESGNLVRRAGNFVPLLIPLFVSVFRRADELALAMDSRCYRGAENRTRMRSLEMTTSDITAVAVAVLILIAVSILGRP